MSIATKAAKATSQGGMTGRVNYGDPGLFGAIGGALKGFVTGGPVGALSGAISGFSGPSKPATIPSNLPALPQPGVGGALARVLPGGKSGYVSAEPAKALKGYHYNKSSYFLKDGTFIPEGTRLVKNRRRNPLNPRALSRAMVRLEQAKRASKKASRITIRKAKSCR